MVVFLVDLYSEMSYHLLEASLSMIALREERNVKLNVSVKSMRNSIILTLDG